MLGSELKSAREHRGLSQNAVAQRAGISRASLTRIEAGDRYPSLRTLEALAEVLRLRIVIDEVETTIELSD